MKISFRAIIAAAIVAGLVTLPVSAQAPAETNTPVVAPKVQTKGATKQAAKKPLVRKTQPVVNPEPGAAKQNNINVRGQATLNSEVIARLKKGDAVTVLEEISVAKPKQDEPSQWFRIALPSTVQVWVHSSFVDATTGTVKPNKLNLRGGPGENYSIVGRLEKGASVKTVGSKDQWLKIETPANAFGFVAAHLIERTPEPVSSPTPPVTQKPPEIVVAPPTTVDVPTNAPAVVAEAPTPTPPVVPPVTPAVAPTVPPVSTVPPVIAPVETVEEAPIEKVRKIVSREGILKGSVSIQAPTYYELRSLDTGKTIDYVYSPSTNIVLRDFKGQRVIVTGEELLDERWQNTPVLVIDTLQAVP